MAPTVGRGLPSRCSGGRIALCSAQDMVRCTPSSRCAGSGSRAHHRAGVAATQLSIGPYDHCLRSCQCARRVRLGRPTGDAFSVEELCALLRCQPRRRVAGGGRCALASRRAGGRLCRYAIWLCRHLRQRSVCEILERDSGAARSGSGASSSWILAHHPPQRLPTLQDSCLGRNWLLRLCIGAHREALAQQSAA